MMEKGTPLPVIAEVLDHVDLQSLARYLGVGSQAVSEAINGLSF